MDSRRRTFTKAVLWNLLGFAVMSLVGFVATGSFATGGAIALVNTCLGFAMYFGYERLWARISWGRVHP
ncbi:DUF2061 domain-containing protein [uncultured Lentibacter sp.]|uniref:DUF2061 domain-containing protein n=1 Tax=uncultured Lentibacter sp. TaxID=1659309 RepID=UPI0026021AF9|nr:DUF2061 domain-containing protein [uncultured Lentibacter sp.]